jgi:hypothetical protein
MSAVVRPHLSGRFEFVSRSKEAVYRQSGEADYDEAGSPPKRGSHPEGAQANKDGQDQADNDPDAVVTPLTVHRER